MSSAARQNAHRVERPALPPDLEVEHGLPRRAESHRGDPLTGGDAIAFAHQKRIVVPVCAQVIAAMPDDDELKKVYEECKAGDLICGNCKARAKELLNKFLEEHQKKREKAKDQIDKYLVIVEWN